MKKIVYASVIFFSMLDLACKNSTMSQEMPQEEMAQRRIGFYQRNGFTLWENEYYQPPYKAGDSFLPMRLMVHGALDSQKDYEKVKQRIYRDVYNAL